MFNPWKTKMKFYFEMLFPMLVVFCYETAPMQYAVSTVNVDGLVFSNRASAAIGLSMPHVFPIVYALMIYFDI